MANGKIFNVMRCKSFLLAGLLLFVSGFTGFCQIRINNQIQLSNMLMFTVIDRADGQVGLILRSESERGYELSNDTRILFKLSDGEIVEVHGKLIDVDTYREADDFWLSFSTDHASVFLSDTDDICLSVAEFVIPEDTFMKLTQGIRKMRVNMLPKPYNKEWRNNKLGKQLSRAYNYARDNSFESEF